MKATELAPQPQAMKLSRRSSRIRIICSRSSANMRQFSGTNFRTPKHFSNKLFQIPVELDAPEGPCIPIFQILIFSIDFCVLKFCFLKENSYQKSYQTHKFNQSAGIHPQNTLPSDNRTVIDPTRPSRSNKQPK